MLVNIEPIYIFGVVHVGSPCTPSLEQLTGAILNRKDMTDVGSLLNV